MDLLNLHPVYTNKISRTFNDQPKDDHGFSTNFPHLLQISERRNLGALKSNYWHIPCIHYQFRSPEESYHHKK